MHLRPKIYCLLLVITVSVPVFASEWFQDYEKGQKAIDKGKCSEGVPYMLEALKKNPKADLRARPYGMQLWEYIPHYYLMKCAVERGDFTAANSYMKGAEEGNISSSTKAGKFRELKQAIQANLGEQKKPVVVTQPKQPTVQPTQPNPTQNKPPEVPTEKKPVITNPPLAHYRILNTA